MLVENNRVSVLTLTLNDVAQALSEQQVFEAGHLLFQLSHQTVVRVLVDDGVAADLLGAVGVPCRGLKKKKLEHLNCLRSVTAYSAWEPCGISSPKE